MTGLEENDPVIQAWAKAYGVIADVFIQIEKEIYDQMMWIGFKPFKITNIKQESEDIKSLQLKLKNMTLVNLHQANTSQLMFLVINFHIELNVTILSYQVKKPFNFWR